MKKILKNKSGFTLIEFLLYLALIGTLLLSLSGLIAMSGQFLERNKSVNEVDQQGVEAMQQILQTIRQAAAINYPPLGSSSSSLSLSMTDPTSNPTIIDLSNQTLRLKSGAGPAVELNNNLTTIDYLSFSNLGTANATSSIRIVFNLRRLSQNTTHSYDFGRLFEAAASLRH